ncbi:MAG: hypothetical protein SCK29_11700 [Bacillota bacterium]|nr:hypothetical protein [Bacillota bacterium]MDW7684767.1 hypothetical protein [Bacillota bacterium]
MSGMLKLDDKLINLRKIFAIFLLALLLLVTKGCGRNNLPNNADHEQQPAGSGAGLTSEQLSELEEQGIYWMGNWEEDGVMHLSVFGADQRALQIIRQIAGPEIVVWHEPESLFVRGKITNIQDPVNPEYTLLTMLVEGEEDEDTQTDRAYVSVSAMTKIIGYQPLTEGFDSRGLRVLDYTQLKVGQEVEVHIVGMILQSLPPQVSASQILILAD